MRPDGRANDELRSVRITPGYLSFAEGSVFIEMGETRVLCAATVEEKVPPFLEGRGQGWVTAEYGLLPRSTPIRSPREARIGQVRGRTFEIQRLIGRALRATVDLTALGERTIILDCDVLQADGGTRAASITGGYVALRLVLEGLIREELVPFQVFKEPVAAVSVGVVEGEERLDLCYEEDSGAQVDFNVVMTADGRFVEVQGTAESEPFSQETMGCLLGLAREGIAQLLEIQRLAWEKGLR